MHALFIGTGASLGVPLVGCHCPTCTSQDPKNKRLRSSLLLKIDGKSILIDAGPDLRAQGLQYKIDHLDGVIFTHAHHDHTAGIDDLRVYHFKNKAAVPCLASKATAEDLRMRYYFMFEEQPKEVSHTKRLELQIIESDNGTINFVGVPVQFFTYSQLGMPILGIRIGRFAYVTDIKEYPSSIFDALKGVDILVLSALRFTPSHMHFSVDDAIDFVEKVKPKQAYLTHISHDLEHEKTNAYLPSPIAMAYDGLEINI